MKRAASGEGGRSVTPRIKRAAIIAAAASVLAACSVNPEARLARVELTSLDTAESLQRVPIDEALGADDRSGYVFAGEEWVARLWFETQPSGAVSGFYQHVLDGGGVAQADMAFGEPWLAGGRRRFEGMTPQGASVEITMTAGLCDSRSGPGSHFSQIVIGELTFSGCGIETGPNPPWSAGLARLQPAIEACLTQIRDADAVAIWGASTTRGAIVRFRGSDGRRFDCVAETQISGRLALRLDPVSENDPRRAGEGDPIYVPYAIPAAGDACRLYERVEDAQGRLLGSLGYESCAPETG